MTEHLKFLPLPRPVEPPKTWDVMLRDACRVTLLPSECLPTNTPEVRKAAVDRIRDMMERQMVHALTFGTGAVYIGCDAGSDEIVVAEAVMWRADEG